MKSEIIITMEETDDKMDINIKGELNSEVSNDIFQVIHKVLKMYE